MGEPDCCVYNRPLSSLVHALVHLVGMRTAVSACSLDFMLNSLKHHNFLPEGVPHGVRDCDGRSGGPAHPVLQAAVQLYCAGCSAFRLFCAAEDSSGLLPTVWPCTAVMRNLAAQICNLPMPASSASLHTFV